MVAGTYANLLAIDSGHALDVQPIEVKQPPVLADIPPVVEVKKLSQENEQKPLEKDPVKGGADGSYLFIFFFLFFPV
jgi:hypothetical protein